MRAWIKVYNVIQDDALTGITDSSGNAVTQVGGGSLFNQMIPGPSQNTWVCVQTSPNGDNSYVFLVALIQVLLLNLNESPFYASAGIPSQQAVQQQAPPDYFLAQIQQRYAQHFTSLVITRVATTAPTPWTYLINVVLFNGAQLNLNVGSR